MIVDAQGVYHDISKHAFDAWSVLNPDSHKHLQSQLFKHPLAESMQMIAKKAGVAITMARVRNPEFTDPDFVLSPQEMGVDVVIHPEKETADAVVRLIRQSSANYAIEFEEGKVQIVGVRLDDHSTSFGAVAATLSNIPV